MASKPIVIISHLFRDLWSPTEKWMHVAPKRTVLTRTFDVKLHFAAAKIITSTVTTAQAIENTNGRLFGVGESPNTFEHWQMAHRSG
jgi:hypothetical protein